MPPLPLHAAPPCLLDDAAAGLLALGEVCWDQHRLNPLCFDELLGFVGVLPMGRAGMRQHE